MLLHAATQNERSKLPDFLHIFQRSPWASVTSVSPYSNVNLSTGPASCDEARLGVSEEMVYWVTNGVSCNQSAEASARSLFSISHERSATSVDTAFLSPSM